MKKIILIPSYEPDEKIIELIKTINTNEFDIIIVDDGSGEEYKNIFNQCEKKAKVISYPNNKGKGYALKTGFKYIKEKYIKDYIITTVDSDGQHKIEDAKKLIEASSNNPDALILGMRLRNKKIPLRSKIGNEITKEIYKITTGLNVYDTQTGLRSFTDNLTDTFLSVEGNRFEYEMKALLQCARNNIPIIEIPIQTIYIQNNTHSHFKTLKDSFRIYKEIIKFSISSIVCFIIDYILYIILFIVTKNITLSNIQARIISASTNYMINKKIVFKNYANPLKTSSSYILLAMIILILNTLILNILIQNLSINYLIAKIITEIILFTISWLIQKYIIFKKTNKT